MLHLALSNIAFVAPPTAVTTRGTVSHATVRAVIDPTVVGEIVAGVAGGVLALRAFAQSGDSIEQPMSTTSIAEPVAEPVVPPANVEAPPTTPSLETKTKIKAVETPAPDGYRYLRLQ